MWSLVTACNTNLIMASSSMEAMLSSINYVANEGHVYVFGSLWSLPLSKVMLTHRLSVVTKVSPRCLLLLEAILGDGISKAIDDCSHTFLLALTGFLTAQHLSYLRRYRKERREEQRKETEVTGNRGAMSLCSLS